MSQHGQALAVALFPLHLQRVVIGIATSRFGLPYASALEVRHRAQQEASRNSGVAQLRAAVSDLPEEGIRNLCVQRRTAKSPIAGMERRKRCDRHEEVSSTAPRVVQLEYRLQANFPLNGEVPGMVFRVTVVVANDRAGTEAEQRGIALAGAGRTQDAVREGIGQPAV